jgi:hypothetical protein
MVKTYDKEIKQDFEWVFKILKSCETDIHFSVADSCMDLWLRKWDHLLKDNAYNYLIGAFRSRYDFYRKRKNLLDGWSSNISK